MCAFVWDAKANLFNQLAPFNLFTHSLSQLWRHVMIVLLTFESVDEILQCGHSNEASSAALLHDAICFSIFYKMKFENFLEFPFLALLGIKGLSWILKSKRTQLSVMKHYFHIVLIYVLVSYFEIHPLQVKSLRSDTAYNTILFEARG